MSIALLLGGAAGLFIGLSLSLWIEGRFLKEALRYHEEAKKHFDKALSCLAEAQKMLNDTQSKHNDAHELHQTALSILDNVSKLRNSVH